MMAVGSTCFFLSFSHCCWDFGPISTCGKKDKRFERLTSSLFFSFLFFFGASNWSQTWQDGLYWEHQTLKDTTATDYVVPKFVTTNHYSSTAMFHTCFMRFVFVCGNSTFWMWHYGLRHYSGLFSSFFSRSLVCCSDSCTLCSIPSISQTFLIPFRITGLLEPIPSIVA